MKVLFEFEIKWFSFPLCVEITNDDGNKRIYIGFLFWHLAIVKESDEE